MAHATQDKECGPTTNSSVLSTTSFHNDPTCVHVTECQYHALSQLSRDPRYAGLYAKHHSFPPWEIVTADHEGNTFVWCVWSGYLGLLRFGLTAKGVEGGDELYWKILSAWEHLLPRFIRSRAQYNNCTVKIYVVKMVFVYIKDGWFQVYLNYVKPNFSGTKSLCFSCRQQPRHSVCSLASKAFLVNRSRVGVRRGIVPNLVLPVPVSEIPGNEPVGTQEVPAFDPIALGEELRQMFGYIALKMEQEGEEVNMDVLQTFLNSMTKNGIHSQSLRPLYEGLMSHIRVHGETLLKPENLEVDETNRKRKKEPVRIFRNRRIPITPEFICSSSDSDTD